MEDIASKLPPSLSCLGQTLTSLETSVLGHNLRRTARQLRDFIQYREFQYIYPNSDLGETETAFTGNRIHLEYSLLAHPFKERQQRQQQQQHQGITTDNPCEEACRIALLIFINSYNQLLPIQSKFWNLMALQLKEALHATDIVSTWNGDLETLYWILFLGAYSATSTPERRVFIGYLTAVGACLDYPSWSSSQEILRSHFYIERLHKIDFFSIWSEAQSAEDISSGQILTPYYPHPESTNSTSQD